jgi:hypothetical protein
VETGPRRLCVDSASRRRQDGEIDRNGPRREASGTIIPERCVESVDEQRPDAHGGDLIVG